VRAYRLAHPLGGGVATPSRGWVLQPVPYDGRLELLSLGFGRGLDAIYEDVALDGAYLAKDQAALP